MKVHRPAQFGASFLLALLSVIPTAGAADREKVNLLAVGDWGLDTPDRKTVATAMADDAQKTQPAAALLLGDNFYVKLASGEDPYFKSFFEDTYDAKRLAIPFYAVMGNHDYKNDNVDKEMTYSASHDTRLKIPARWYRLDLPKENPLVTILMLDSDQPLMPPEMWQQQLDWLTTELAKPHAPWLVCAAHHDLFGNGAHGDNGVLQTTWGPLFKQAKVDLYLCGHEHTLQHLEIKDWSISFVVAGGGGAKRKAMLRDNRGPFSKAEMGFAALSFTPEQMDVRLIDGHGKLLHEFTRDHGGKTTVLANSPSDKATDKPLKTLQSAD